MDNFDLEMHKLDVEMHKQYRRDRDTFVTFVMWLAIFFGVMGIIIFIQMYREFSNIVIH